MHRHNCRWSNGRWCAVLLLAVATSAAAAGPDSVPTIRGKLLETDGVRVLRVMGDPHDRGYAHGYLLAEDIVRLIDRYISAENISGGARKYEAIARNLDHLMEVPSPYLVEIDGMLAGIEKRLNGETQVPALGRKLTRKDLVAINCVPDSVGFGCSSFAVWGRLTIDGNTIAGRNLDWHAIDGLRDSQIVIANIPAKDSGEAAWISVTWPGLIGCLTGMNERGVTVSMHDAFVGTTRNAVNLTPRGFALRAAIEKARADHVEADVLGVLSKHRVLVGNIVPVAAPKSGENRPSVVFEYDGANRNSKGVTVRRPAGDAATADCFQIATNHYRERGKPESCNRYRKLGKCVSHVEKGDVVSIDGAWKMLDDVAMGGGGLVTYHSVVFEPNAMRMHVSFSTKRESAPDGRRSTLDVAKLLERPVGVIASGR